MTQNPFLLAADNSPQLLELLRSNPTLASSQDAHGYSLMHAAASYNHINLLRTLANEFQVDPNLKDEDGETALFVVETVEAAKCLVEELHGDATITNAEGLTAEQKIREEGEFLVVADYLHVEDLREARGTEAAHAGSTSGGDDDALDRPPPLPPGVKVDVRTANAEEASEMETADVDPEFRRRIDELAARDDFSADSAQRELRELIKDAVRKVDDGGREVRQRTE